VQTYNYPNISFIPFQCENIELLKREFSANKFNIEPFEIEINGLGYFEYPSKVLFLKVIKSDELIHIHKVLTEMLLKHTDSINKYYTTDMWIPHITIAMDDLTDDNFIKFKEVLENEIFEFKQIITEIQLIQQCKGRFEIIGSKKLK